jgi:hypothetical protein
MTQHYASKLQPNIWRLAIILCLLVLIGSNQAFALSQNDQTCQQYATCFYDPTATTASSCSTATSVSVTSTNSNLDYAGMPILSAAQLAAVAANESTYQQAATQVGIPWELLAAIHYRETDLSLINPSDNSNGLYQIVSKSYPAGQVTQATFLQESIDAAQFLKSETPNLSTMADAATIKQAIFSYNGAAQAYVAQAVSLGYPSSQGYEGSPYVMNYADAKRDPTVDTSGWGQIKTDHGGISYPADSSQFGAFLVYTDLSGSTLGGTCASVSCNVNDASAPVSSNASAGLSTVRQNVVCLAEQELALWSSQPGYPHPAFSETGYLKYTQNRREEWCADFVSWLYHESNYPLQTGDNWSIPYVPNIEILGETNLNFHWHPTGSGYAPKPGDMAIHYNGGHVNIFISSSNGVNTYIGGDQGSGPYPGGSIVSTEVGTDASLGVDGYVSPD